MSSYSVEIHGLAPIPVGHRVRLDFYSAETQARGLFAKPEPRKVRPHSPIVTDLETGIVWMPMIAREDSTRQPAQHYFGRIASTEVFTSGYDGGGSPHTQVIATITRLLVAPLDPAEVGA